jgi:hemimethylated DNA binding protein
MGPLERDRIISLTLYRQLLRWCFALQKEEFPNEIMEHFFPPLLLEAPHEIDPYRMELLYEASINADDPTNASNDAIVVRRALGLLPKRTIYKRRFMTIPIRTVVDIKNCIRAFFRLNNVDLPNVEHDRISYSNLLDYQKKRRNMAFENLKSLNELYSDDLVGLLESRSRHLDREHVQVWLGQVVQHRRERWRGIVIGWDKLQRNHRQKEDVTTLTSLTTKSYEPLHKSESDANGTAVQVKILLDAGDAQTLSTATKWSLTEQSDLIAVTDQQLCRVRNKYSKNIFVSYHPSTGRFLPKPISVYEYPLDTADLDVASLRTIDVESRQLCEDVADGVRTFASQLESIVVETSGDNPTTELLKSFMEKLNLLSTSTYLKLQDQFSLDVPVTKKAALSVHGLMIFSISVLETMMQRRIAVRERHKMLFSVGDVVLHKKYGFRGVVVAWDPVPTVNVTRWDGLRDVQDPMTKPFYQIVPDQQDCIDAFGGERPLRYVCQENLEPCPPDRTLLDVDLDAGWSRDDIAYVAPELVRFKYGADLGDGGNCERCLQALEERINEWKCEARSRAPNDLISKISLANMVRLLQCVDNLEDATVVQEMIKEMRKAHASIELRSKFETSLAALVAGNTKSAHDRYLALVELDPLYADAWSKLATCEFMLGKYKEAERSSLRALEIEPEHYQTMNGLGLVHMEMKEYQEAIDYFRKSLDIDPWSPVAAKLSLCLDMMDAIHDDEIPS